MSPGLRGAFLPRSPKRASTGAWRALEMTRGAGRGRRLALLGEEISGLAGLPAKSHVGKQASFAQRAESPFFSRIEHDRAFRAIQDVGDKAVLAGILRSVGAGAAVDHEPPMGFSGVAF